LGVDLVLPPPASRAGSFPRQWDATVLASCARGYVKLWASEARTARRHGRWRLHGQADSSNWERDQSDAARNRWRLARGNRTSCRCCWHCS